MAKLWPGGRARSARCCGCRLRLTGCLRRPVLVVPKYRATGLGQCKTPCRQTRSLQSTPETNFSGALTSGGRAGAGSRHFSTSQPAAAVETLPTGVGRSRWPRDWRRHMQTWCPPALAALLAAGPGPVAPIKCFAEHRSRGLIASAGSGGKDFCIDRDQ